MHYTLVSSYITAKYILLTHNEYVTLLYTYDINIRDAR